MERLPRSRCCSTRPITRVEAESRAEGEPAGEGGTVLGARGTRGETEADRALTVLSERVQQGAGGLHGVVGQAQGAGEDIGGAAGDHREAGQTVQVSRAGDRSRPR